MLESGFSRAKALRVLLILLIFILLTVLLLVGDSFLGKMRSRQLPSACVFCPFKDNVTFDNITQILHFDVNLLENPPSNVINILFFFAHVNRNPVLKDKFRVCITSLFKHATSQLHLHILTDSLSLTSAIQLLRETAPSAKTSVKVSLYEENVLLGPLQDLVDFVRPYFSFKRGAYYSDGLFYISIGLFKIMLLQRLIVIDADVKFLDDIKNLYDHFEHFTPEAVIGIAREQQPVYRHVLHEYRRLNNGTKIGNPPPNGIPGFNSGVLLLDLEKMRQSHIYINIVNNSTLVSNLVEKYKFKGHLGDQDFYTLISFEYPALFYLLPCTWNRQLCQWWKRHGYKDVFESYHECIGKIKLLHGNCNTFIPGT